MAGIKNIKNSKLIIIIKIKVRLRIECFEAKNCCRAGWIKKSEITWIRTVQKLL